MKVPICTILITLGTLLLGSFPDAAGALTANRDLIAAGNWWRLFSGNFAHWTFQHMVWDLLMFAVLGALAEIDCRKRFAALTALAAALCPFAVFAWSPEIQFYRGLSGIDCALFASV